MIARHRDDGQFYHVLVVSSTVKSTIANHHVRRHRHLPHTPHRTGNRSQTFSAQMADVIMSSE